MAAASGDQVDAESQVTPAGVLMRPSRPLTASTTPGIELEELGKVVMMIILLLLMVMVMMMMMNI